MAAGKAVVEKAFLGIRVIEEAGTLSGRNKSFDSLGKE